MLLTSVELTTLIASAFELILCLCYSFVATAVVRSRLRKEAFYQIFLAIAFAGIGNSFVIIFMRCSTQVFYLGKEFGTMMNVLAYVSHVFNFAHISIKILQVANRFTALHFPTRQEEIWRFRNSMFMISFLYTLPIFAYSFMIDQPAVYILLANGKYTYASIPAYLQTIAKMISAGMSAIFIIVTVPMNLSLCIGMRKLMSNNKSSSHKERTFFFYVVVMTVVNLFKCAHQIIWLYATLTNDVTLNLFSLFSYAYPTALTIFAPPVALMLMSKEFRRTVLYRTNKVNRTHSTFTSSRHGDGVSAITSVH